MLKEAEHHNTMNKPSSRTQCHLAPEGLTQEMLDSAVVLAWEGWRAKWTRVKAAHTDKAASPSHVVGGCECSFEGSGRSSIFQEPLWLLCPLGFPLVLALWDMGQRYWQAVTSSACDAVCTDSSKVGLQTSEITVSDQQELHKLHPSDFPPPSLFLSPTPHADRLLPYASHADRLPSYPSSC